MQAPNKAQHHSQRPRQCAEEPCPHEQLAELHRPADFDRRTFDEMSQSETHWLSKSSTRPARELQTSDEREAVHDSVANEVVAMQWEAEGAALAGQ